MERQNREDVRAIAHHGNNAWSQWYLVMAAPQPCQGFESRNTGHRGYKKIKIDFIPEDCGIYEWKVKHNDIGKVAYVGKTCNDDHSSLRDRIARYCADGSHKHTRINTVLKNDGELYVRYKKYSNNADATEAERFYLEKYNYAWNKIQNIKERNLTFGL